MPKLRQQVKELVDYQKTIQNKHTISIMTFFAIVYLDLKELFKEDRKEEIFNYLYEIRYKK